MVKFGKHQEAFLENEHSGSDLYVVPYCEVKKSIPMENDNDNNETSVCAGAGAAEEAFVDEWRACLLRATESFDEAVRDLWKCVFNKISSLPESRGAIPDQALGKFVSLSDAESAQDLLTTLKDVHSTALINAEALRKLVKKFDKGADRRGHIHLSPKLLPEIYAANFTIGQPTLETGISLLREHLGLAEDDVVGDKMEARKSMMMADDQEEKGDTGDDEGFLFLPRNNTHDRLVDGRKSELEWLQNLVRSIAATEICHIVAHRGFHNPQARSDRRPIENSLNAYEAAWTRGIHLCECDVALTKDEKLILAHDEDFSRLALDPTSQNSQRHVRDLTLKELMSTPLNSGCRPPLLIDVLRSACAIGGEAKLIVEIKPGNTDAGTALARMFARHPDLMAHVEAVMSFDAFAMHKLRRQMAMVLEEQLYYQQCQQQQEQHSQNQQQRSGVFSSSCSVSLPTSMSLRNFGYPIDSSSNLAARAAGGGDALDENSSRTEEKEDKKSSLIRGRYESADHFGVGISINVLRPSTGSLLSSSPFNPQRDPQSQTNSPLPDWAPATTRMAPKLLLLTVCDPPQKTCELRLDVSNLTPVDSWLQGGAGDSEGVTNGSLDGVYMQFQKEMLEPEGMHNLREISDKYDVGVWGHNGRDPDDYETFHRLVRECGVSYVNSDLPRRFSNSDQGLSIG